MAGFSREAGMMLSLPLLENTERPEPSMPPVKGSKIIPWRSCVEPPSVVGTMMAAPLESIIGAPSFLLKSPVRKSSAGTEKSADRPTTPQHHSHREHKNNLSFLMRPP